jgi:tRNA A58 N-methylase Trm61
MYLQKFLTILLTGISIISIEAIEHKQQNHNLKAETQIFAQETTTPSPSPTTTPQERPGDVPYLPTAQLIVDAMLELAQVKKDDVLYDLGSGDGRIPITAAQKFGTRGVGVDIDPERIQESNTNAQKAGVSDRVSFRQQDLFKTDLREATVVTLYLLPDVNLKLRPKLLKELKPGTRIVSHSFDMGDWKPMRTMQVGGTTIYLWIVPK